MVTAHGRTGVVDADHPAPARRRWVDDHPLLVVAILAGIGAVASALWIWNRRHLGGLDPDEAGYLSTALRYQRAVGPSPIALWEEVRTTETAPLVPLLSVVPLTLGPRDVRSAMLLQPVLVVALAVAVAGVTRRLASPRWAILAGAVVAGLPTTVLAGQAYWYGLAAAVAAALALWSLLATRLEGRWSWAIALAVAALLLSRTMAVAFLPGLVLAGVVVAASDRARLRRGAAVLAAGIAIAGPWWWSQRAAIWDYLFAYGYGERAEEWGDGGVLARVGLRAERVGEAFGWSTTVVILCVTAAVLVARRDDWFRRPLAGARRDAIALVAFVALGQLALLTTQNRGIWFELPVVAAAVPLVVAVLARAPWRPVGIAAAAALVLTTVVTSLDIRLDGADHVGDAWAEHDPRFGPEGPDGAPEVAADWWDVNVALVDELAALTGEGADGAVSVTGSTFLVNTNSMELAAELDAWSPRFGVVDSRGGDDAIEGDLAGDSGAARQERERYLVVVRHPGTTFSPDRRWRAVDAAAGRLGWTEQWSRPLPAGGEVVVLRAPDGQDGAG